ncbi:MAG: GNAT family N-acetyltransferase [Bacteroidales bacterium]|nr:GNAT family N-acetyltransferase [Bacteroidales bacterium]
MDTLKWEIVRYESSRKQQWDSFVRESRNATFLFLRDYMEYHSDRFEDHSLLAYRKGKLLAILPANAVGDTLYSHQGLTYGGWLLPMRHIDAEDVLCLFEAWNDYAPAHGFRGCVYKPVPYIYTRRPAQEDLYALHRFGARISASLISNAIYLPDPAPMTPSRIRALNYARRNADGLSFNTDADVAAFHRMLSHCLKEKHSASPVHNTEELSLLKNRFPENIRICTLERAGNPEAGICLYLSEATAHCQYIATTEYARECRLLTLLVSEILKMPEVRRRRYLDFGTSNEDGGRKLNAGLYHNKFSYGGGGVAYDTWKIDFAPQR